MIDRWTDALNHANEHGGHSMHECVDHCAVCFIFSASLIGNMDEDERVVSVTGLAGQMACQSVLDLMADAQEAA